MPRLSRALPKSVLCLACLAPVAWLAWGVVSSSLGANPIEVITHETGTWTLRFLVLTLAVTPVRRLMGWNALVRYRRMLGLFAFFYGVLHLLTYAWLDQFFALDEIARDIAKRPFITVGFAAFVLMVPLAVTSTAGWIRRLGGRRWQALHRLVYASAVLGVIHYWWLVKADIERPLRYAVIVGALLAVRVAWRYWPIAARRATIRPPMRTLPLVGVALASATFLMPASTSADTPAAGMAAAATAFLDTLDAGQRATAKLAFDTDERFNFHFTPRPRAGLPLKQMTPAQRTAAMKLLQVGLSEKGYTKAEAIRALEPVLAEIEKDPVRRDPELYYVTIFGDPSATGTWGWRYEGHHLSQNWTIVNGASIASSPQFFGSNPAEVRSGPKKGTRVLAAEEDLARALLEKLTEAQRAKAVISPDAPDDILTSNLRKAAMQEDRGVTHDELTPEQRGLLLALIEEYAAAQPKALATERLEKIRSAGLGKVTFAWMGALERGQRHYYRVQGPTFLIEYDNTQNNANHIHAVWRDFNGDWGEDLLAQHYRNSPHHAKGPGGGHGHAHGAKRR